MEAKYVDWVRQRIVDHAPDASEPDRVQVLALAAYNLSIGAGTLFGMHWPESGLSDVESLREEALDQLGRWFEVLDDHDGVEVARFIQKHDLRVAIPEPVLELLRRVESREGLELPEASPDQVETMARRIMSAPTVLKTSWLQVQAAAQASMLAFERLQWPHEPFMVEPPATAAHLAAIENELPFMLPDNFVHVMGLWGRTAFFTWSIPDQSRSALPERASTVGAGGFEFGLWDLGRVLQMRAQCDIWRDVAQNPPGSDEDRRWERALPFAGQDGKYLAVDVSEDPREAPVVFLHSLQDTDQGHGWRLAPSLAEFLVKWAELGFPGEDVDSLAPFKEADGITIENDAAQQWRTFLFGEGS